MKSQAYEAIGYFYNVGIVCRCSEQMLDVNQLTQTLDLLTMQPKSPSPGTVTFGQPRSPGSGWPVQVSM